MLAIRINPDPRAALCRHHFSKVVSTSATMTAAADTTEPFPSAIASPPGPSLDSAEPKLRLLLVEDHGAMRGALAALLRHRCYDVLAASSLAEAREHFANGHCDILVLDLGLPDGDGCTLLAEFRQQRPNLRAIAITGRCGLDDLACARAAGFATHVAKPVVFAELESALSELARLPTRS